MNILPFRLLSLLRLTMLVIGILFSSNMGFITSGSIFFTNLLLFWLFSRFIDAYDVGKQWYSPVQNNSVRTYCLLISIAITQWMIVFQISILLKFMRSIGGYETAISAVLTVLGFCLLWTLFRAPQILSSWLKRADLQLAINDTFHEALAVAYDEYILYGQGGLKERIRDSD